MIPRLRKNPQKKRQATLIWLIVVMSAVLCPVESRFLSFPFRLPVNGDILGIPSARAEVPGPTPSPTPSTSNRVPDLTFEAVGCRRRTSCKRLEDVRSLLRETPDHHRPEAAAEDCQGLKDKFAKASCQQRNAMRAH